MQEEMNRLFDQMFNRLPEGKELGEGIGPPVWISLKPKIT